MSEYYPIYCGSKYWHTFLFCEKCEEFTTHYVEAPLIPFDTPSTFDTRVMPWKCKKCYPLKVKEERIE